MTTEAFAPAKINLSLHVTGQRSDGYHLLDSLVVFVDVGDHLWFQAGPKMGVEVSGPFAQGVPTDRRNLVWQAAELAGWTGLIQLEKNLPHGAGIGSGSADAAAVLRTLGGGQGAAALGADVPVCLVQRVQRMRGIGDLLTPLSALPEMEVLLVNPSVIVPTGPVFQALASKHNPPMPDDIPDFHDVAGFCHWLGQQRNDLEAPALHIAPVIRDVLTAMEGALLSRMSGSGATCFGIYDSGAEAAAQEISAAHPDWWVVTGRLLS